MSATITSVEPIEFSITELTSSNEYIKQRRTVEILPTESTAYGSANSTYRMTFNVGASGREFLDGINSYIRCELQVTATAAANTHFVKAFLDEGGIHSLIKRVTIQLRNGTRIEDIDDYNKLYSMISNATMSKDHVDSVESMQSGDSMAYRPYLDVNYVRADDAKVPEADDLKFDVADVVLRTPARAMFTNNNKRVVSFKIMSNFLNHVKYIPLPMLQQLQIVIEWERPKIGLFLEKKLAADGTALANILDADDVSYAITSPRFVAMLVEPEQSILDKYMKAYMNEGVSLSYQTYKRFKSRVANSSSLNTELQLSAKSVRHLLAVLQDDGAFVEGKDSIAYPSNSVFRKFGLKSYSFRSGSLRFPEHGPVDTSTTFASEAFTQLMMALNQHNNKMFDTRITILDWRNDVQRRFSGTNLIDFTDSRKFVIGVDCTKQDDFTGVDTTGNPIQVELNFENPVAVANFLCFVCHDAILTLADGTSGIIRS